MPDQDDDLVKKVALAIGAVLIIIAIILGVV